MNKLKKQIRGHHVAKLDPLEIANYDLGGKSPTEVIHNSYRFGKEAVVWRSMDARCTSWIDVVMAGQYSYYYILWAFSFRGVLGMI